MGIKSIKAVCGGDIRPDAKRLNPQLLKEKSVSEAAPAKKTAIPSRQRKGQKITNERILSFYKKLFGEALESNAEVASYKEYRKTKKELAEKAESKRTEESGRSLSEKIAIVKASGTEGERTHTGNPDRENEDTPFRIQSGGQKRGRAYGRRIQYHSELCRT